MIGAFITCFTMPLLDKMHIDDPVGASATHGFNFFFLILLINILNISYFINHSSFDIGASGIWGIIAIGLFADNPYPLNTTNGRKGLLKGI